MFEKILDTVASWAGLDDETIVLDLCCGTGVIGIALSKHVKKIIGVEMIESAVQDCKANCALNDLPTEGPEAKCEYFCGKAEELLPEISKKIAGNKIVAIVDPPRSGLHPAVLKSMRTCIGLDKIVYVSCNAVSMADNLYHLTMPEGRKRKAPGFSPVEFMGADLFPWSDHVECLMLLERDYT